MSICSEIREWLKRRGLEITYDREDEKRCVFNFRDRNLFERAKRKFGEEDAVWISTSSITCDKEKESCEANFVAPMERFCELYLEECCDDGINLCRIHVDPEYPRIGLEIKPVDFKKKEKLREALDDFLNCVR